jgi:lantibiotic modifying enzyme
MRVDSSTHSESRMQFAERFPILIGARAGEARSIAFEIANELEQLPFSSSHGLKGDAAIALLLAKCGRQSALDRLEASLNLLVGQGTTISLFGGLAGISWLLRLLECDDEQESVGRKLDQAILRHLNVPQWKERFDLMSGLAGVGTHIVGRRDDRAFEIARLVLSHLESSAMRDDAGTTWYTPVQFMPSSWRDSFPGGAIDLGVAHGVPGVIGMLAQFLANDIESTRTQRLLTSTVDWLLTSVPSKIPRFGYYWPGSRPEVIRIGWCNGDAGVAAVLLQASQVLSSSSIENEALRILRQCIGPARMHSSRDAGICHGSAGLAHIFATAFRCTGCSQIRTEAEYWLNHIMSSKNHEDGVAGFASLIFENDQPKWRTDTSLASGVVGTALVLLAATETAEPEWQRLFLL